MQKYIIFSVLLILEQAILYCIVNNLISFKYCLIPFFNLFNTFDELPYFTLIKPTIIKLYFSFTLFSISFFKRNKSSSVFL